MIDYDARKDVEKLNEIIAAFEARLTLLEGFITREQDQWADSPSLFAYGSLSDFVVHEVEHNMHIDGPIPGLRITKD